MNKLVTATAFLMLAGVFTERSMAQFIGGRGGVANTTRNFIANRPTVSPYVQLGARSTGFGLPNYHTLVRPQLERRQEEAQQRRQTAQLQSDLSNIRGQFQRSQAQAASQMTTGKVGWSSRGLPRFSSTLNYYPGFRMIPRRR